jgi:hypothetical protein
MSNDAVLNVGAPVPASTGLSQVERVVDTFVAPSKTFTDILRSASWWLPFILLVVSSLSTAFVVDKQVGFDRVYENQVHQSERTEKQLADSTPEQRDRIIKIGTASTKYFTYGSFVFILIVLAIYSLVLWGAFNFGLGAKTTFGQVFAVSMYAALPYLITAILTIVFLYFGGNAESYDYKNPVATNLAYFFPDMTGGMKGLLQSLDVVKIWSDVLQVIGMAIIARKTILQSALIVGIFWLLGVAVTVAGAMFS